MDGEQGPEVAPQTAVGVAVAEMARSLADARPAADNSGMIDQPRELEDLKCAAAALQARIAVALDLVHRPESGQRGHAAHPRRDGDRTAQ